jgi:hypothetical protein
MKSLLKILRKQRPRLALRPALDQRAARARLSALSAPHARS